MQRGRLWFVATMVLTAAAVPASAAVVVVTESETPAPAQGAAKPATAAKAQYRGTMYVEGDRVRIEGTSATKDGDMEAIVLYRPQPESFVYLDANEKSYTEMTGDDVKRVGAAIENARKQMQAQLSKMAPEQRKVVEQAMAGMGSEALLKPPPPKTALEPAKAVANGATDKVADRACKGYDVTRGGKKIAEACVATWPDLGMSAKDIEGLKKMTTFQQKMLSEVNFEGLQAAPGAEAFEVIDQLNGFPLRVKTGMNGKRPMSMRVVKIERKGVDPKLFDVPQGWTKKEFAAEGE
jgi:hypothetical protein